MEKPSQKLHHRRIRGKGKNPYTNCGVFNLMNSNVVTMRVMVRE